MPKRTTAIAAVVVLLFALTGCGEETATPADEPKPAAAPLTATEAPETPEASEPNADESGFINHVRDNLRPDTRIADVPDADLIAKGYEACDRIRADESTDHMTFFEGEERIAGYYRDSGAVITAARGFLCIDLIDYMPANQNP